MKEIYKGTKRLIFPILVCFVLNVVCTLCSVALPTLMTNVIEKGINEGNMQYVYKACVLMGVVSLVNAGLSILVYKISCDISNKYMHDLRVRVFHKAVALSAKQAKEIGSASLVTRSLEDVGTISGVSWMIVNVFSNIPITLIAGTILAFRQSVLLAAIMLAFTPVIVLVVYFCQRNTHKYWEIADKDIDTQNDLLRSRLTGIRVVRAFNQEETEQKKVEAATRHMSKSIVKGNMRAQLIAPISTFVLNLAILLIVVVSAQQMIKPSSAVTAAGVFAVTEYVGMILSGILSIGYMLAQLPQFKNKCRRVEEILTTEDENAGYVGGELRSDGHIRLENVGFAYAGDGLAISGITAEIAAGETVAFIGGTGSGKSTLVRLLCGLDRPTEGKIWFGDEDLSRYAPSEIRKNVSCVRQRDIVFSGTLRSSADTLGTHTDEELLAALRDGQMGGFVDEHAEGLDYPIEERGGNLSGGQKQRLCIARALLKEAPIYIFDDSFSALDFMTESKLRGRLKERLAGKTQIVITQRVSSAKHCDRIFVFDGGELIAQGTHDELINSCRIYREIYRSQTGEQMEEQNENEDEKE